MSALPAHDEYVSFCEGVRRLCKIDLLQYRRGQMERRVRSFAERRGSTRLAEYLSLLGEREDELDDFLDRVTINVSQLWRNPEQWRGLAEHVLPELATPSGIRAWSAGCSYGAEAYTLAAVCAQRVPGTRVDILGTDIDPRMVARARDGRFSSEEARSAPTAALERFFVRDGDGWRAGARIRSVCTFETGDLLRMPFPQDAYDLVLCRNTAIYFTDDVRDTLHRRLACALRTDGYLLVGSTERVTRPPEIGLAPARPFLYRKL